MYYCSVHWSLCFRFITCSGYNLGLARIRGVFYLAYMRRHNVSVSLGSGRYKLQVGKYECKSEIYMTTNLTVATASSKRRVAKVFAFCKRNQTSVKCKVAKVFAFCKHFASYQTRPETNKHQHQNCKCLCVITRYTICTEYFQVNKETI